tara:strand:- start:16 stop:1206 length:1191 start_codon:yes stop_codon:yes gene_type:complete
MGFRKTFSGKEPSVPEAFAPSAGESELVSRVGAYDAFTDSNVINVAWGGNSNTETGGAYDGRNILIHHIKVTNTNPDKSKELHFWSNNYTSRVIDHQDYLFNIPVAISKDDGDGKLDTVIDFPIPLLVMGGCNIGVKDVNSYGAGAWDNNVRAEICYSVLDGTPDSASFDELKYKYLSAFHTYAAGSTDGSSGGEFAIQPDTQSTVWKEDIEIWGGMVLNYLNAGGSAATAKTYVKNADGNIVATISVLKGETNAITLNYPTGIVWPTMTGSFQTPTMPTLDTSSSGINWPGIAPSGYSIHFPTLSGGDIGSLPSIDMGSIVWADDHSPSQEKVWALKVGGSDAQVTFYPYPVYCAGNAAADSNMKVYTGASGSNHTRGTWFYRPVKAQGVDHGWV